MQREDAFKGYEVIKHSSIGKLELGFNTLLSCGLSFDEIGDRFMVKLGINSKRNIFAVRRKKICKTIFL